jgi:hypothetical protein
MFLLHATTEKLQDKHVGISEWQILGLCVWEINTII